jgi:hypothetical protein
MPDLFSPNGNRLIIDAGADYDANITPEIDKAIRHLPIVISGMLMGATKLRNATGSSNFEIVTQNDPNTQRPRAYVVPKNNKGIHEELSQSVLLKAALGMAGQSVDIT